MGQKQLDKFSKYWKNAEKLIAMDTVSSRSNSQCAAFVATELESLGMKTSLHEYQDEQGTHKQQVIGVLGPDTEEGLILCGHLDTVPFADQPGWTRDALNLVEDGLNLYGRGTSDMKLFAASTIEALASVDEKKLKRPIVCIFTADEEVGCQGADKLSPQLVHLLQQTPLPKAALIGEPTSFKMINRHKGVGHFEVIFHGKAWHSSRPDLGKNAILAAAKFTQLVENLNNQYAGEASELFEKEFPDFPRNYLHLASINGGMALNMVPDQIRLGLSYRCFPNESPQKVYEDCSKMLEHHFEKSEYSLSKLNATPAMPTARHDKLEGVLSEVCGCSQTQSVSFATDGGVLASLGIQSYIWGPGQIEVAHRPDEYMPIADFLNAPEYLHTIIQKMLY